MTSVFNSSNNSLLKYFILIKEPYYIGVWDVTAVGDCDSHVIVVQAWKRIWC